MTKQTATGIQLDEVIQYDADGVPIGSGNPLPSAVLSVTIPTAIVSGQKAVTTAGTQVVLAATQALLSGVTVKALAANTGLIYVGPAAVDSSTGFELAAGEEKFIEVDDLDAVWIDSAVNGEGVSYIGS